MLFFLQKNIILISKKEKISILNYLRESLLEGMEIINSVDLLLKEKIVLKKYPSIYFLTYIKIHLESGLNLQDALYNSRLINSNEFMILENSCDLLKSILFITKQKN